MEFLLPDHTVVASYLDLRSRVVEMIRSVDESSMQRRVPHCPGWTVGDLVGHMIGVPEDIVAGRMEGVTSDAWTRAQVERHRGKSASELADAYGATADDFDAVLPHIPSPVNSQLVMDAITHEHDLRFALDQDGARDSDAVTVGVGWLLNMVDQRRPGFGVRLAESGVSPWELLRCLGGRRSAVQMDALGLDGALIVELLAGTPLRPPT